MKNLLVTLKWIKSYCLNYFHYIIIITAIGGILSTASVYRALVTKNLVDAAISGKMPLIMKPLILLAILIIIEIFFRSFSQFLTANSSVKLSADIQRKLYTHILNSKWQYQVKYHSGHLLARVTSDVVTITDTIVNTFPNIISLLILLVTSFITLYHLEPILAFLSITIVPISIFISRLFAKRLKEIHKKSQEVDANYRSFMQESIQNLLIVKTFCLENNNLEDLSKLQNSKISLSLKRSSIGILANIFMSIGSWCGFFMVFCWGAANLSNGTTSYGTLTALLQLISTIQVPFLGLAGSIPQLAIALGSAERLIEIDTLPLECRHYSEVDSNLLDNIPTNIQFKNVSFSYLQDIPVLKNVTFNIEAGQTIGILGASGEGKTTIIRLLLSLIDTEGGCIYLKNNNEELIVNPSSRNLFSYVPQGNTLFSGTIRSNLLYGNKNASEEDIKLAITAAGALNFINSLDRKLDTVIGEKGIGLSEGQAQRIAIARGLIRKKPILILDEATSSLDTETELKVLTNIHNLEHSPTCIIITHRLSALSICDRLFKLESGYLRELNPYSKEESAAALNSDIRL